MPMYSVVVKSRVGDPPGSGTAGGLSQGRESNPAVAVAIGGDGDGE